MSREITSIFDLSGKVAVITGGAGMLGQMHAEIIAEAGGIDPSGPYTGESYDAAALIVLAMQAGGSADRQSIADNIMGVANAPGDEILPGELAKALKILAGGGQINYQGATDVELTDVGEASGSFKEVEVGGGKFNTVQIR